MAKRSFPATFVLIDPTEHGKIAAEQETIDLTALEINNDLSVINTLNSPDQRSRKRRKATHEIHGEREPSDSIDEAFGLGLPSPKTRRAIENVPDCRLNRQQSAALQALGAQGPRFLGRCSAAVSAGTGHWQRKTNGLTTERRLLPGAAVNKGQSCHTSLTLMTQREQVDMLAGHLTLRVARNDEFLSFSKDPVFLLWLLFKKYSEGHTEAKLQFFDRNTATTRGGERAAFYPALGMCELLGVSGELLRKRGGCFTHEYVSHGPLRLNQSQMRQASAQELIRDGIASIWAPLVPIPGQKHPKASVLRQKAFPGYEYAHLPAVPISKPLLEFARQVSLNFVHNASEPPLHIFICFLCFEKRAQKPLRFVRWIERRYTAQDVRDLYTDAHGRVLPGFTRVAENLPNYKQFLDLVRACIEIFPHLPRLPENEVDIVPTRYQNAAHGRDSEDEDNDEDSDSDEGAGGSFEADFCEKMCTLSRQEFGDWGNEEFLP